MERDNSGLDSVLRVGAQEIELEPDLLEVLPMLMQQELLAVVMRAYCAGAKIPNTGRLVIKTAVWVVG